MELAMYYTDSNRVDTKEALRNYVSLLDNLEQALSSKRGDYLLLLRHAIDARSKLISDLDRKAEEIEELQTEIRLNHGNLLELNKALNDWAETTKSFNPEVDKRLVSLGTETLNTLNLAEKRSCLYSMALLLTTLVGGLALFILSATTKLLWANGPDLFSLLTLLFQLFAGLALISSSAQEKAFEVVYQLANKHITHVWAGLASAIAFLMVVLTVNLVALPLIGRYAYTAAIDALKNGQAADARNFLDLSTHMLPLDILNIINNDISNPRISAARFQIGQIYEHIGDTSQAVAIYEVTLAEDDFMLLARWRLADILVEQKNFSRALTLIDAGLEQLATGQISLDLVDSDTQTQAQYLLLVTRGKAFLSMKKPLAAIGDLNNAALIVDNNPDLFQLIGENGSGIYTASLHYWLARTLDILKETDTARIEWDQVRRIPSNTTNSTEHLWQTEAVERLENQP